MTDYKKNWEQIRAAGVLPNEEAVKKQVRSKIYKKISQADRGSVYCRGKIEAIRSAGTHAD